MGHQELIDALIIEGEEKIRSIWQKAKAESEKILLVRDNKILETKERYEQLRQIIYHKKKQKVMLEAEKKARRIRLEAEEIFLEKIYNLSLSILPILREDYDLYAFKKELFECKWETVEVNQADQAIAKDMFPDSDILVDNSISGGLRVKTKDERICIDNTLEKRLERAWNQIIPELIKEIYDITGIRK
jgi:vacuolar-type H+-ATPase subunit E/Vma4